MSALVAGALGIVGRNLVDHLASSGWDVTGIARAAPGAMPPSYRHIKLDLLDQAACCAALGGLGDVTHVFYCARAGHPDPSEEARRNLAMLRNLAEPVIAAAPNLVHVGLIHGTKWYGSHLGPYRTPAREDDPRHDGANFYYAQHDYIASRANGWSWSTLRPHIVCAGTTGYPYNLMTLLGAYGTLCRENGRNLDFPGTEACYRSVSQATDVGLLCRAMAWAATEPRCAGESFNVVNADYFRWCDVWPVLADFFGVPAGVVRTQSLAATMADATDHWARIVQARQLQPLALRSLANWTFGDFLFRADWDDMSSTAKIRRYGFDGVVTTEEMMLNILGGLRRVKVIP